MNTAMGRRNAAGQVRITQDRRRGLFMLKHGFSALATLLVVLPLLGLSYEAIAAAVDARRFPPPGRLVDVGGRLMHLHCSGAGSPTVVMDAGLGGWSLDWSMVQPAVSQSTRVCSYDRAGFGWSQPGAAPGDAQQAVEDLHALLANSVERGPFILVGHSNGGLRALLYAHAYPQEVAGLVLVDPTPHATDAERIAFLSASEQAEYQSMVQALKPEPEAGGFDISALMETLRLFGVTRLLTDMLLEGSPYAYVDAALQPTYLFGMNQPARLATIRAETVQRQATIDRVRAIPTLGHLPVTVLVSVKLASFYRDAPPAEPSGRLLELIQKTVWAAQHELAGLSSNSTLTAVERSGHYIQFDRPDAVVEAIHTTVDTMRHH